MSDDKSDEKYSIRQAWHDVLVYEEGEGRSIEFDCPSLASNPCRIRVPTAAQWVAQTPAWAHDRRSLIVDRLRRSGALVYEREPLDVSKGPNEFAEIATVLSPDGTFRVECIEEYDGRGPPWATVRIVALPGELVLVHLPLHGIAGPIEFPEPGIVVLPLGARNGQRHLLRVNVASGTFVLDQAGGEQKLQDLQARLELVPAGAVPSPPSSPASSLSRPRTKPIWGPTLFPQIGDRTAVIIDVLLIASGLWMSLAGATLFDRLIGVVAMVFFAACLVPPIRALRRKGVARQRNPGSAAGPAGGPRRPTFSPYLPLLAAAATIPWIIVLFLGLLFMVGDMPYESTPGKDRAFDVLAALPAAVGFVAGLVGMKDGWARRRIEILCLRFGCLACALLLCAFAWGLVN